MRPAPAVTTAVGVGTEPVTLHEIVSILVFFREADVRRNGAIDLRSVTTSRGRNTEAGGGGGGNTGGARHLDGLVDHSRDDGGRGDGVDGVGGGADAASTAAGQRGNTSGHWGGGGDEARAASRARGARDGGGGGDRGDTRALGRRLLAGGARGGGGGLLGRRNGDQGAADDVAGRGHDGGLGRAVGDGGGTAGDGLVLGAVDGALGEGVDAGGHAGGAGRAVRDGGGTRGDGDLLGGVDGGLNLSGDGRSQETSENCGLHLDGFLVGFKYLVSSDFQGGRKDRTEALGLYAFVVKEWTTEVKLSQRLWR